MFVCFGNSYKLKCGVVVFFLIIYMSDGDFSKSYFLSDIISREARLDEKN